MDAFHLLAQIEHPEWAPSFDVCCCHGAAEAFGDAASRTPGAAAAAAAWHPGSSSVARKALLAMIHRDDAWVLSPHFPFPGIGKLRVVEEEGGGSSSNQHFAYVPLSASGY